MRRFSKIGQNLFPNQFFFALLLFLLYFLSCQSAAWGKKKRSKGNVYFINLQEMSTIYSIYYNPYEARPSVSHVSALLKNPHRMPPCSGSISSCCNANDHFISDTEGLIFLQVRSLLINLCFPSFFFPHSVFLLSRDPLLLLTES